MSEIIDFDRIESEEGPQAVRIAQYFQFKNVGVVYDIGCGPGIYTQAFRREGVEAYGYDIDSRIRIEPYLFQKSLFELTLDDMPKGRLDSTGLVMSLEVGEHLELKNAGEYVLQLASFGDRILFSAARPGQGGQGHINCQFKRFWLELFAQFGFFLDVEDTDLFVNYLVQGYHMGWLRNNAMILRKCFSSKTHV